MTTLTIDTYKIATKLQKKGYTKEQAEGFIEAIQEINLDEVATKADIAELKTSISDIRYEILKWVIPMILGLYALMLVKHGG